MRAQEQDWSYRAALVVASLLWSKGAIRAAGRAPRTHKEGCGRNFWNGERREAPVGPGDARWVNSSALPIEIQQVDLLTALRVCISPPQ